MGCEVGIQGQWGGPAIVLENFSCHGVSSENSGWPRKGSQMLGRSSLCKVYVQRQSVPHRLMGLNAWSPVGVTVRRLWNLWGVGPCWRRWILGVGYSWGSQSGLLPALSLLSCLLRGDQAAALWPYCHGVCMPSPWHMMDCVTPLPLSTSKSLLCLMLVRYLVVAVNK